MPSHQCDFLPYRASPEALSHFHSVCGDTHCSPWEHLSQVTIWYYSMWERLYLISFPARLKKRPAPELSLEFFVFNIQAPKFLTPFSSCLKPHSFILTAPKHPRALFSPNDREAQWGEMTSKSGVGAQDSGRALLAPVRDLERTI